MNRTASGAAAPDALAAVAPAPPPFVYLYLAFASGYVLSYLYRTVTSVISPELSRELELTASSLGLLTSVYFIAFGAVQIPAGMLLDRFGPRRVEPVLLLIAGTGAITFAYAEDVGGLLIGRALIGVGVATCLMAPLKAISAWYPSERHASLSSWIMVAGGIGVVAATAPTEYALRFITWRTLFVGLGAATYVAAAWIWIAVPDLSRPAHTSGFGAQWAGVRNVFAHPRFWWIAPLASIGTGSFMGILGLWSVPYLMQVGGFDRASAARILLVLGIVMLGGYLLAGLFATPLARRGIHPRHLYAFGFSLNAMSLAAIVLGFPGSYLWWTLYGFGASVNVLGFGVLNQGFARDLAARANTALNVLMFTGSFSTQWGIGVIVDAARGGLGYDTASGLRLAFATMLALDVVALAWFALGWRVHAAHRRVAN